MPKEILLPAMTSDFESGVIEAWCKNVGDPVVPGDVIAEVSTDKAVIELQADAAGTLGKILVPAGDADVRVDTPIALLLLEGETSESLAEASAAMPAGGQRLRASPSARRLAAELGVDLAAVAGSGPNGRIVRGDIQVANVDQVPNTIAIGERPPGTQIPNDKIRKVIARRLTEAKRDIPHFYLDIDYEIDALMGLRQQLNSIGEGDYRLTLNDMIVKAVALALRECPDVNAGWAEDAMLRHADVDVCIAVDTARGLMTPIVRNADKKGVVEISKEVQSLAEKAREGRLQPDEYQGGGITVSNLGMYGIRSFSAIINPPQSCILAVGQGRKRPVVKDGKIEVATEMSCTLSVDHRAIDGVAGAKFLQALALNLEQPVRLVVDGI